ncbi:MULTISPECIES: MarR family winged helix-turn-helix transcriptional regulator [Pseudonocardia]|uniref:MarR family transcriptional regulator n=2 Tax=Pseudonocardia TaxID=1847 RepID=A0ABQ0S5R7_9PSEU|nr:MULTISPECIES: MarR family transcriptional regulator [Pseudonocardia]OSY43944.1 putative HTH-type transcriptional regulator [Pseudonocardia autotrophica]TDN74323.1 DNA-binding MarR family transcriptional regulator [Pseudonocardia autotrophica]BBG05087.1 MarR family transcriptional regulator [Pseudonocardia autotrophica]GEC28216.1 MarR family transcriptional regulator [Pseudonocardia saturnea]
MTRWLDDREQAAWRGYLRMQARLQAELHRRLQAESGLSIADFDVLVALTDRPDERVRVLELASSLEWEKSRLSHHLARMQRRGLITREECDDDGRGNFVVLTEQGRAAIEEAAPGHVESVRELVFDILTDDDVDALARIAGTVGAQLDRARSDRAQPDRARR